MPNLVVAGPRLHHTDVFGPTRAERARLRSPLPTGGDLSQEAQFLRAARASRELAKARAALRTYNRLVRQLGLSARAVHGLHLQVTLLYEDTPHIAVERPVQAPRISGFKAFKPPSRAELRLEARRNRVPFAILWDRFPPETAEERAQMEKDLGKGATVAEAVDPFSKWLRAQAQSEARKEKTTAGALLKDSAWVAKQREFYDLVMSIDL